MGHRRRGSVLSGQARWGLAAGLAAVVSIQVGELLARAAGEQAAVPARPEKDAPAPGKARPALPRAYRDICAQGNAKYAARDFAGAIERYEKAIARIPNQPLGYYLLGEAQLAAGNLGDAETAWNRAALEAVEGDPALHARALFVLADLHERRGEWDAARAAWQTYLDWATRFPEANGAPASARARIAVIDAVRKQDTAYEPVRKRIAETADGGVFTDPAKPPPGK